MHFAPAMYVGATPWARRPVGDGQNTLKTAERNDCEFSFPRRKKFVKLLPGLTYIGMKHVM